MTERSLSRRALLRASAGGLAAGAASGFAGCAATSGSDSSGNAGASRIEQWAVATGEVDYRQELQTSYTDLTRVRDLESVLPDEFVESYHPAFEEEYGEPPGVDWEAMEWYVRIGRPLVLAADHEVADVVRRLAGEYGYEVVSEDVDGYTSLVGPDSREGYAVDGSRILWADEHATDDPTEALQTLVATQHRGVDMAVDENEDFVAALDAVGGDTVRTSPGIESQNVAMRSSSLKLGRNTTTRTVVWLYDDESDVDEETLRENDPLDADQLRFEGRTVLRTWEIATERLFQ